MTRAGPVRPDPSRRIVLGIGGGIAAYKVCEVLRRLTEAHHQVQVVPTEAALRFVGVPTWEALSGSPVHHDMFVDVAQVPHIRLGQGAELVLIAPATADLLARAAHGQADDLLCAMLLTTRCPVLFVPAMHTEMWEHPATQHNVAILRSRGAVVAQPASGRLTGVDSGAGRLPEPAEIVELVTLLLHRPDALPSDLTGRHVAISAGGTREPLDPVRYLGNRSSGRQGYALARVAAQRGARVTLIAAHTAELPDPAGAEIVRVGTADQMRKAMLDVAAHADAVVMAAAVADFRPAEQRLNKIKKTGSTPDPLSLALTPDILAELTRRRPGGQVVVGFAAETGDCAGDVLAYGRGKLAGKGCHLLVVNAVGEGGAFEVGHNMGWLLGDDGAETELPEGPKALLASYVWDAVAARLTR